MKFVYTFLSILQLLGFPLLESLENCDTTIPTCIHYLSLDEALRLTLFNQREILISNLEVEKKFGFFEETAEPFDVYLDMQIMYDQSRFFQYFPLGLRTDFSQFETTASLNVNKRTRLGTRFLMTSQVDLVVNRLLPKIGQAPAPTTNRGKLTFQVVQPLLRNFIASPETMREQSAFKEAIAEEFDNLQIISERLRDSIFNYLEVVAAKRILEIQQDAEKRINKLTKDVIVLIREDEIAENDLNQTLEQLATQKVQVALAIQNLTATIENLKTSMGVIQPSGCIKSICGKQLICEFNVMDDFPPLPAPHKDLKCEEYFWTYIALKNSFNLWASKYREIAAADLLLGAYNETLPAVDVFGGWSKTNFTVNEEANDLLSPLTSGGAQYDTFIGIRFSTPIWRDGPIGRYRQAEASQQQTVFETQLLAQNLVRDLRIALNDHVNLWDAVQNAIEAANKAETLVINERIKLKEGVSTLFFVVDFENKLTQRLLDKISLIKEYFQNIAQIRFLTATLLTLSCDMKIAEIADVLRYPNRECFTKELMN